MNNLQLKCKNSSKTNFSNSTNKLLFSLIIFILLFSAASVPAQTARWRYVTTISEGVKFYLDEIKPLPGGGSVTAWEKIVKPDGSFFVSFVEWDCAGKRRQAHQLTAYRPDKTVIGTVKQPVWSPVMPGSSADLLYRRVCLPAAPVRVIQVTVETALLHSQPSDRAPLLRASRRGERFCLVEGTGEGGWFNVVDEATQVDYWLRGEMFRILDPEKKIQPKTESAGGKAKPLVRSKARRQGN